MKIHSKHGHDVEVTHNFRNQSNGRPRVIELTATCGGTIKTKAITLGSEDGLPPNVPADKLQEIIQQELDSHRQELADRTSWHEYIRLATENLQ